MSVGGCISVCEQLVCVVRGAVCAVSHTVFAPGSNNLVSWTALNMTSLYIEVVAAISIFFIHFNTSVTYKKRRW